MTEFFQLDWVKAPGARPEILFLRREKPDDEEDESGAHSHSEAHLAFPGTYSHLTLSDRSCVADFVPTGGRTEEGDEGGMYTAMRQTWEEIGLDLAEAAYIPIGQLDDREITTSLGKRLLMILSPFVFLQLTPTTTPVDPAPGTTLHWVPFTELLPDILTHVRAKKGRRGKKHHRPKWLSVTVDASSRLAPRHSRIIKLLMTVLVGNMKFPAIVVNPATTVTIASVPADERIIDEKRAFVETGTFSKMRPRRKYQELKLWGLSLGMTLDLLVFMTPPADTNVLVPPDAEIVGLPILAPSLTSVFPRFSYPDVNFWIWCVSLLKYSIGDVVLNGYCGPGSLASATARSYADGRQACAQAVRTTDGQHLVPIYTPCFVLTQMDAYRINWTGSALSTFYTAVRKALVVVIVVRAIWLVIGLVFSAWFVFMR